MKKLVLFFCLFAGFFSFAQDSSTYVIRYADRKAGFIKIRREKNGMSHIHHTLNDRGRGVDHQYRIQTNTQKIIDRFEIKGITLSASVDTVSTVIYRYDKLFYNIKGKDTSRTDFKSSGMLNFAFNSWAPEFFFPIIADTSIYSEQSYSHEKLLERTFIVNKKKVQAELYNFSLKNSKTINLFWLYPNHHLLAQVSPWTDIIESDKEQLRSEIRRINDSAYYSLFEQGSAEVFKKSIDQFALTGCNIIDIEKGVLIPNQTILISDGKIQQTGDSSSITIPSGYKQIVASGKTVMPGLWDMHAHYMPQFGYQYLFNGITSVRDLGNNLSLKTVKQKIDTHKFIGPHIAWMSGFIDLHGEMAGPCGIFINNLKEGIEAIRTYHRLGFQSIKLYSSIKPSYVKALAAEAHKLGMRVHGHIPAFMTAEEAIRDGYDEINHLNMLLLGYFGKTIDTRTRLRLSLMRDRAYEVSPFSEYGQHLIALMKEKKTILDPTSVLYRGVTLTERATKRDSTEKACIDTIFSWLKVLYQNGIRFVPGTDAAGGNGLVNELKNYATIGMSNADVLRSATLWSAQYCKMEKLLGTVTAGKKADLIIVSGNPLLNISALDKIEMVISKGKLFDTKDLR
jgi:imidazolonepropionase-like amidohydrolase